METRDLLFRIITLFGVGVAISSFAYSQKKSDAFLFPQEQSPPSKTINLTDGFKIVVKNDLHTIIDQSGKPVTAVSYQEVSWTNHSHTPINGYIGYKNNDLWGMLHLKSAKISSASYTSLIPYNENLIVASKREKSTIQRNYGVITTSEKTVVPFRYNFLAPAGLQLIAAKHIDNKNRYGVINKKEGIIIPFVYSRIFALSGGQLSVVNDERKAALFSGDGIRLTPFEYDSILFLSENLHLIDKNGKKGVINTRGKLVVQPSYKKIIQSQEGTLKGLPFSEWDLLTLENNLLQQLAYDTITSINRSLLKASIGRYEYIIDHKDHPITELGARKFGTFKNGYATVEDGGKYGAIANYSDIIIPPVYDSVVRYSDFFIAKKQVSRADEWSIFNKDGEKVSKISYDQIGAWSSGYFSVKKNGVWGFANEYGHEVIKARFDSVFDFQQDIAKVYHKKKFAVVDEFGRYVVPHNFDMIEIINPDIFLVKSNFNFAIYKRGTGETYQGYYQLYGENGFIIEKTNSGKVGLFNTRGQRILRSEYDFIKVAVGGKLHVFGKDGKIGLLNREGGILIGLEDGLEEVQLASEDFIGVKINKKYGFIDFNGKLRVANRYDSIGWFSESMAPINLLGRWGYIDKIERLKIQPKYQKAGSFKNETAIVGRGNRFGIIDKNGKEVVKISYDKIVRNEFGNYLTQVGNKAGLVKNDGYEVIFPKYDSVTDLGNGHFIVGNYGKFGLVNESGVSTIPVKYQKLHYDRTSELLFGLKSSDWETIAIKK